MDCASGDETSLARPQDKLVLIVEDDEGQIELISHLLAREGFRTERAGDGAAALRMVSKLKPDAIVLDLMLPGLSGYELLRELQAGGFGGIPILVLTARSMDRKTVEMIASEPNVKEFCQKPPNAAFLMGLHNLLKTRPPGSGAPS